MMMMMMMMGWRWWWWWWWWSTPIQQFILYCFYDRRKVQHIISILFWNMTICNTFHYVSVERDTNLKALLNVHLIMIFNFLLVLALTLLCILSSLMRLNVRVAYTLIRLITLVTITTGANDCSEIQRFKRYQPTTN